VDPESDNLDEWCLQMVSCLGQTRCLVWQFSPWTVILSKVLVAPEQN
jgi:hypothetical protein